MKYTEGNFIPTNGGVSLQLHHYDVICSTEYGDIAAESFPQQRVCCAVTTVICFLWAKGTVSISQHFVCQKTINLKWCCKVLKSQL